jgi:hypothetical protein
MVSLDGFDANKVEPNKPREVIPAGDYLAIIADSEKKDTKAGDGAYIKLQLQIIQEGPYKGRKLFANLNLWNPSKQAVDIAQSELSAICHATGVLQPKDTSQLHNKPLCVVVKTRMYQGEMQNEVAGYKNRNEAGKKAAPPAKAEASGDKEKVPWD